MREHLSLFLRAWLIVCLTAANVTFVSRGDWLMMGLTGFGISAVWFWNAGTAAHSTCKAAWAIYATGAATGTLSGAWLARLL